MNWSFSAYRSFQHCPRQWFYRSVLANARAKDPQRQVAYHLSKLEGIAAWRGKIVDAIISDTILPSIMRGRPVSLVEARRLAWAAFTQQRAQRSAGQAHPSTNGQFFELVYGLPLTDDTFDQAWSDVDTALQHFYASESLWQLLRRGTRLLPQRPLSFRHGDVSIRVVPDLIVFRSSDPPAILDWKVNSRAVRDYWLQLVTGALALTRCTPHRDWPINAVNCATQDILLLEVQLLTGDIRTHRVTEADVVDVENYIALSAMEMQLAGADEAADGHKPEDYPTAHDPQTCQTCPFKKICWEAAT